MPVRLRAAVFTAEDPAPTAAFWAALLRRQVVDDGAGLLLPGDARQVGLRVVPGRPAPPGAARMHLHVTSEAEGDQRVVVERALRLGARHVDVGQRPDEGHVVLTDPGGNALCVIEPDNRYLAGCGPFGEVACDGTRAVGLFWSAALGWPLVWDQDEETAVQAPAGGTKVAWGGPPVRPLDPAEGQHLELVADGSLGAEVDRLVALGAARHGQDGGVVLLTDPDGAPFRLHA